MGEPGFDLHVYYDRGQVRPGERFAEGCGFGMQGLFDWYFGSDVGGVGVGFAHDLCDGAMATGAYVNFNNHPLADTRGFFASLGAPWAHARAEALLARIPTDWHPWYLGLFPNREGSPVRLGSFVGKASQLAYAHDPNALRADLANCDFDAVSEEMLTRVTALAALPFPLELQLDATEEGTGDTLGVDLTLGLRSAKSVRAAFSPGGDAARACELLEGWGIADPRWHAIASVSTSRLVPQAYGDQAPEAMLMACLPAFVKAKWRAGSPLAAKVYLNCAARPLGT